jgi:three-Cys-motif partner protein
VDYEYGSRADQIEEFFRAKRPWSRVKDTILDKYIDAYLRTIQSLGSEILLIDGFAGPGRFGDGSDGSPLIVLNRIAKAPKHKVGMSALFADTRRGHRTALESNIGGYLQTGVAERPLPDCAAAIARALEVGARRTLFFYLDPYGIADLDFEMLRKVFARGEAQSTEVLINFSFLTFMRMSGNWSYDDSAASIAARVKATKIDTLNRSMGGDYWVQIVTDPSLTKIEREDAVVDAYMDQVRRYFSFVNSVPVKDQSDQPGVPSDDLAKYHLIFGSRNAKAVRYMNDIAYAALEPYFKTFTDGLLFDMRPDRYVPAPPAEIKEEIIGIVGARRMLRPAIYEALVPQHFMQYKTPQYRAMIDELVFDEKRLFRDPAGIKRQRQMNDTTLLSTRPWPGGKGP